MTAAAAGTTAVCCGGRTMPVPRQLRNQESRSVFMKMIWTNHSRPSDLNLKASRKKQSPVNFRGKLDAWMRESVVEIVKRLPETPLLVQVFSDKTTAEKAEEDDWASVRKKWENGGAPIPDGMIFVEQIEDKKDDMREHSRRVNPEAKSREWGIVVQGRGEECHPACYLLKTDQVGSGIGLRCTHFCLVPVKNFTETAKSQLTNSWLLRAK